MEEIAGDFHGVSISKTPLHPLPSTETLLLFNEPLRHLHVNDSPAAPTTPVHHM